MFPSLKNGLFSLETMRKSQRKGGGKKLLRTNKLALVLCLLFMLMSLSACGSKQETAAVEGTVASGEAAEEISAVQEETTEAMAEVMEESQEAEEAAPDTPVTTEESLTEEAEEHKTTEAGYGQIIGISMAELEEKMAAKESFFVYFATLQCPYCHEFHDMLVDYVQDHDITMYQVILDYEEKPEEENRAYIAQLFEEFKTVPGVFLVHDGENGNYLDTYNLGVGEEVFHTWVEEWKDRVNP